MLRKTRTEKSGLRLGKCASMRPQRNAAENPGFARGAKLRPLASMRPQRNAAENVRPRGAPRDRPPGFNEAAA